MPLPPEDIARGQSMPIHHLHLANLQESSVTLSWTTDQPTTAYIRFGETADTLTQVAYNSQGARSNSKTHIVALDNLTPQTTYHFEIVSGAEAVERGTFTTLPSLAGLPDSDTIYGQLFWADGTTPAADVLVYLTLQDADSTGSQGEATILSALTDQNGYWHTNLGNARHATSGESFTYSATGDEVVLSVQSATDSTITTALDASQLRPAPPIILEETAAWELYLPLIGN